MRKVSKPLIGVTLGDPAGIGPEVAVRAVTCRQVRRLAHAVLIGDARIVERAAAVVGCTWPLQAVGSIQEAAVLYENRPSQSVVVLDCWAADPRQIPLGKLSARAGRAAYEWVLAGAKLALGHEIDALVTAPLSKEAVLRAGVKGFRGHTELLAQLSGTRRFAMMLAGGSLRVVLVTTHLALKRVSRELTSEAVLEKIALTRDFLHGLGIGSPRIAVAALNPHAGEGGAFGDEETRIIRPAIARARRAGGEVIGPLPADTLFAQHLRRPFDAVVVMYHDQGLIPLKLLSFGRGVNITLGLPFVRTSPDHGTAFDLAGRGAADAGSMIQAVCTAAALARAMHS